MCIILFFLSLSLNKLAAIIDLLNDVTMTLCGSREPAIRSWYPVSIILSFFNLFFFFARLFSSFLFNFRPFSFLTSMSTYSYIIKVSFNLMYIRDYTNPLVCFIHIVHYRRRFRLVLILDSIATLHILTFLFSFRCRKGNRKKSATEQNRVQHTNTSSNIVLLATSIHR